MCHVALRPARTMQVSASSHGQQSAGGGGCSWQCGDFSQTRAHFGFGQLDGRWHFQSQIGSSQTDSQTGCGLVQQLGQPMAPARAALSELGTQRPVSAVGDFPAPTADFTDAQAAINAADAAAAAVEIEQESSSDTLQAVEESPPRYKEQPPVEQPPVAEVSLRSPREELGELVAEATAPSSGLQQMLQPAFEEWTSGKIDTAELERRKAAAAVELRVQQLLRVAFEEWTSGKIDTAELERRKAAAPAQASTEQQQTCQKQDALDSADEAYTALADLQPGTQRQQPQQQPQQPQQQPQPAPAPLGRPADYPLARASYVGGRGPSGFPVTESGAWSGSWSDEQPAWAGPLKEAASQPGTAGWPFVLPAEIASSARDGDTKAVLSWLDAGGHSDATYDNGANAIGKVSGTTLLMLASVNGHTPLVDTLLERQASLNLLNSNDVSALMWAAHHGHLDIVVRLLRAGAEPGLRNVNGATAMMCAADAGHMECALAIKETLERATLPACPPVSQPAHSQGGTQGRKPATEQRPRAYPTTESGSWTGSWSEEEAEWRGLGHIRLDGK